MLYDPYIQHSFNEDGSASFTVSFADDDHRFSVSNDGERAEVEYEESLTFRGQIQTLDLDRDVYEALMRSDEMTEYLDLHDLGSVRRADV